MPVFRVWFQGSWVIVVVPGDTQVTPGFMNKGDLSAGEGSDRRRHLSSGKKLHFGWCPPSSPVSPVTPLWLFQHCPLSSPLCCPVCCSLSRAHGREVLCDPTPPCPQAWHLLCVEDFLSQPGHCRDVLSRPGLAKNSVGGKTSEMKC